MSSLLSCFEYGWNHTCDPWVIVLFSGASFALSILALCLLVSLRIGLVRMDQLVMYRKKVKPSVPVDVEVGSDLPKGAKGVCAPEGRGCPVVPAMGHFGARTASC